MVKFVIGVFFVFCSLVNVAQNVVIKGVAQKQENKEIGVWVYSDYISKTEKQLTYSTIDSLGHFVLEFNTKEIQYINLKIEKNVASMYVEPNANYEVILSIPDSLTYQNPNLERDMKILINIKSKVEINALTIDYDKRFEEFLTNEYIAFVRRNPQPQIDSFRVAMRSFYSTVANPYFQNYISYTIAALEEKTGASIKKLFANHIDAKPVLYTHTEYMNFFNTFYKHKLQDLVVGNKVTNVEYQVNEKNSFKGLIEAMKQDPFLQNDTIRELVAIKGLYESYYEGIFKKRNIVSLLEQVVSETTIEEHKYVAQNILNSFSKLQPGTVAPFFQLPDKLGLTHSLDEFKGKKYVYLIFFDPQSTTCLQQMKVIPSLKKKYGAKIEFVAICSSKNIADFRDFCNQNPKFDWLFLYDNTGMLLKNSYEIKSFPTYFLINPEGKIVQAPAEGPEGDIERAFYDITKPKNKKTNVGDKTNR
ncbi:MAG: TlpA disulfide reductase family protein [Bacteroidia bacterium]